MLYTIEGAYMKLQKQDPLFIQAYEVIKKKILRGVLQPGDRLPEVHLAEELGVSRNPVREALRLLMQDGLVCPTPSGQIVHPMTIEDIKEIYECRMMVEPFAASLAAERIQPEEAQVLYQHIDQAEKCFEAGDIDKVIEANSAFHNSIVLYSHNQLVYSTFKTIDNLVIVSRNIEMKVHQRPINYQDEHREMVRLLELKKSSHIKDLVMSHINADWKYFEMCSNSTETTF
jgi:DNA-binding GntR family transcriptional regulator